jgi:hypothetical protein
MATFAGRTQLVRDLPLWGDSARLYASCGGSDDYLELAFPDDPDLVSAIQEKLAGIDPCPGDEGLDLRFHEGPPATVSMLALHVGVFFLSFIYKIIYFVWLALPGALYIAVRAVHPEFEVRFTKRDLAGTLVLAAGSIVAVRVAALSAH